MNVSEALKKAEEAHSMHTQSADHNCSTLGRVPCILAQEIRRLNFELGKLYDERRDEVQMLKQTILDLEDKIDELRDWIGSGSTHTPSNHTQNT